MPFHRPLLCTSSVVSGELHVPATALSYESPQPGRPHQSLDSAPGGHMVALTVQRRVTLAGAVDAEVLRVHLLHHRCGRSISAMLLCQAAGARAPSPESAQALGGAFVGAQGGEYGVGEPSAQQAQGRGPCLARGPLVFRRRPYRVRTCGTGSPRSCAGRC